MCKVFSEKTVQSARKLPLLFFVSPTGAGETRWPDPGEGRKKEILVITTVGRPVHSANYHPNRCENSWAIHLDSSVARQSGERPARPRVGRKTDGIKTFVRWRNQQTPTRQLWVRLALCTWCACGPWWCYLATSLSGSDYAFQNWYLQVPGKKGEWPNKWDYVTIHTNYHTHSAETPQWSLSSAAKETATITHLNIVKKGQNKEISSMRLMVLQNRMGPDLLTARSGGVCVMFWWSY